MMCFNMSGAVVVEIVLQLSSNPGLTVNVSGEGLTVNVSGEGLTVNVSDEGLTERIW